MRRILPGALALLLATPAFADTVAYDAALAHPDFSQVDPGWYYDTSPNADFTVDTGGTTRGANPSGPIETGLRVRQGSLPAAGLILGHDSTGLLPGNIYTVSAASPWVFDFSVDLRPGDVYSLKLSNVSVSLVITNDTTGESDALNPINPLTAWTDQQGFNNSSDPHDPFYIKGVAQTGDWGIQDSKSFSSTILPGSAPILPNFNPSAPDDYTITLTVTQTVNQVVTTLSSDTIHVDVTAATPLPKSAFLVLPILPLLLTLRRPDSARAL